MQSFLCVCVDGRGGGAHYRQQLTDGLHMTTQEGVTAELQSFSLVSYARLLRSRAVCSGPKCGPGGGVGLAVARSESCLKENGSVK